MATCLFIVADKTSLTAYDNMIRGRITAAGHTVTDISDEDSADLTKDMIVCSGSVLSTTLGTKYKDFAGGFLLLNGGAADEMDMATANTANDGTDTQVVMTSAGAAHALGAGLSGTVTVLASAATVNFSGYSQVTADCVKISDNLQTTGVDTTEYCYETGTTGQNSHVFQGRRVFMGFFPISGETTLNANRQALLDAAIAWIAPSSVADGYYLLEDGTIGYVLEQGGGYLILEGWADREFADREQVTVALQAVPRSGAW